MNKVPASSPKPEAPIVRTLVSNQRAIPFELQEDPDPIPHERNLQPSEVPAATRALADLALLLFNSNEFVYAY